MSTAGRKLKAEWADRIDQRAIDWLWRPWIARGVITVVDGELGAGKSSLLFDVIARVSTGRAFPRFDQTGDERPTPEAAAAAEARAAGKVLLLALKDPVATVVAPRLEAAGADLANVVIFRKAEEAGHDRPTRDSALQLPRDLDLLAGECRELRPLLVVIDSLSAALGKDEDDRPCKMNDEPAMCRLIGLLKDLTEECQTAIVLIRRLNQSVGAPALRRGLGSATIADQARCVLLVAADPLGPESQVLAMVKSNLEAAPRSVRFGVSGAPIRWLGPSDLTADELVRPGDTSQSPAIESAKYFLKTTLFEPRPYTWPELAELAAKEDIAEITLRRARRELKLIKTPRGQRCFVWSLPSQILDEMHCEARLAGHQQ